MTAKSAKHSFGTIRSIEGSRTSSSSVPLSELARYIRSQVESDDAEYANGASAHDLAKVVWRTETQDFGGYSERDAKSVAAAVIDSDWLAEHVRVLAERAWDQGAVAGMARMDGQLPDNPYRRQGNGPP